MYVYGIGPLMSLLHGLQLCCCRGRPISHTRRAMNYAKMEKSRIGKELIQSSQPCLPYGVERCFCTKMVRRRRQRSQSTWYPPSDQRAPLLVRASHKHDGRHASRPSLNNCSGDCIRNKTHYRTRRGYQDASFNMSQRSGDCRAYHILMRIDITRVT